METFRASLNSVTNDADETDRILQRLLAVTVDLVGIETGDLISFAARLMATGLSADQAITAITGVTQRVAEQGKSAEVTTRVLEQFTQAINANVVTAQDFRPIAREIPTLFRDMSNAMGVTITSLDDFRAASEAVGGPTQAIILLLEEMTRASRGADLNTLNAQLDILQDQSRILAAELGEHLIPAIVSIVKELNNWIQAFNEMDDDAQAAIAWAAALATGLTALTAVIGGATVAFGAFNASLVAITGAGGLAGVAGVVGQAAGALTRIGGVLTRVAGVGNLAVTAVVTLTQAWQMIYDAFQQTPPFEDAVDSIQELNLIASETAMILGLLPEALQNASQETRTEIELLTERADQLRNSIRNAINRGDQEEAAGLREEYRRISAQLDELTNSFVPAVGSVEEATAAITALAENTPPAVRFTRELSESTIGAEQAFRALTPTLQQAALVYAGFTGEIDGVNLAIRQHEVTLVDAAREAELFGQIYRELQTQITSYAADQAIANAEANLVNPAISAAADSLRDYSDVLLEAGINYREIDDVSEDVIDASRRIGEGFDALRGSIESTEPSLDVFDTQMQQIAVETEQATDAFEVFRDGALTFIDDIAFGLDPLINKLGDTGDEINSFVGAIASAVSGDIPGVIRNVLDIVIPGLTDPQRLLDFQQPEVAGDPRQLNLQGLGLTPVQLEQLDLSGVAPGLRALLGLEGGGEGGFNVFQAQSRQDLARRTAEATGTDRQAIEDIAREQYGAGAYDAEFAAATAEVVEQIVEDLAESAVDAIDTSLIENALQRAQFGLGLAGDEEDFESRRQALLQAVNTFYDAEFERIGQIAESEAELRDLREDNELARQRALQRAITATNTFREARLDAEREVAEEAARTAAQQQREQERAAAAAEREAQRQARNAERQAEREAREAEREAQRQAREAERLAQEQQRQEQRAQRDAERAAQRQSAAGAGLLQTGVGRAQFGLGLAGDEADFESRRDTLIAATNTYYDNELTRIDGLTEAEIQLHSLRTELARDRALQQAREAANPFEQQRLRDAAEAERERERAEAEAQREAEREAAQAQREAEREATQAQREAERLQREQMRNAEREERERLRNAERAAREQQRLLERQQREEQRAIEQRLREEMRLHDEIESLRNDALENEADRLDALANLNQQHADRLLAIERRAEREREDLGRSRLRSGEEFLINEARALEDTLDELSQQFTGFGFDEIPEGFELPGGFDAREFIRREAEELTRTQRQRGREDFILQEGLLVSSPFQEDARRQILEQLRSGALTTRQAERFIGTQAVEGFIGEQRAVADAERDRTQREVDINAQADATATAIQDALTPLLSAENPTAQLESTTAALNSQNASMHAANITAEASNNQMFAAGVGGLTLAATELQGAAAALDIGSIANQITTAFDPILDTLQNFPAAFGSAVTGAFQQIPSAATQGVEIATAQHAIPTSVETINISASVVNVSGGTVNSGGGGASDSGRMGDVILDSEKVGEVIDKSLVRADQNGRTVGSYRR